MRIRGLVAIGIVLATVSALANGSVSNAELEQKYGNAVLTLGQFYPGSTLNFDANGQPVNPSQPGPWTLYGQLRVQEISFKDGALQIPDGGCFSSTTPTANSSAIWARLRRTTKRLSTFAKTQESSSTGMPRHRRDRSHLGLPCCRARNC
jgi:hypothetical protein